MAELQTQLQSALGDAFRLEREITGGGMSRLFLATEASLNRQVVIKLLPPEMTSDVSAARFKQEIELAAQLQHPNILPVLTAGAHDELIYYVMPYVAGESLRHRLTTQGRLPVEDARTILKEVADALAYAHARGVVHRDIKPENILLQQGHAVLTDFGVARAVAEAQSGGRLTQTGMAVGTPGYMSPEQVAGEAHVDARADVYSLAVVAYELLTGQQPFTGASIQAVLAAHLTEAAKPVTELRAETPPELSTTIAKALAKNPGDRLQTAAEFRDAIAVRTGDVALGAPGRRKRWVGLGAAVAFLAVAAVVLWPRGWHVDGDPRQSLVVFPFENQTGDASLDWLEDGAMNLLGLGLAHWEDLRVFDDERTSSLMRRREVESARALDFDRAQDMAMEANVGTLVLGDFRYEGDSLVVQAKIHDVASGTRLSTEIVRAGRGDDPRSVFDAMVGRILNLSGAPVGERPGVTAQTTHSLEAYRLYLAGTEQLQQFQLDSSQALLERAVALDSTFAMAYLQLRSVNGWRAGGDAAYGLSLIDEARRYSENLPSRYRSFIDIYTASANLEWARAGALAAEMIARDSSDAQAWYEYGEALFHDAALAAQRGGFGNQGKALRAFERALRIDSAMVIAYRHITDVLSACDNRIQNTAPGQLTFVCLADSAVYGTRTELESLLGPAEIERLRLEAEDALLRTVRQWVAVAPNADQARDRYLLVAINKGRYQEAENQTEILRERGDTARALAYRAVVLHGRQEFAAAADSMALAFADLPIDVDGLNQEGSPFAWAPAVFAAAGRSEAVRNSLDTIWGRTIIGAPDRLPIFGPDGPLMSKDALLDFLRVATHNGTTPVPQSGPTWEAYEALQASMPRDTTILSRAIGQFNGLGLVEVALLDGNDQTVRNVVPFLQSEARIPGNAALAAVDGDTASVRSALAIVERRRADGEHIAPQEIRIWALVAGRIGEPRIAIDLYTAVDDVPFSESPAFALVRSWAERGALYQQIGDDNRALDMYERVLEALGTGDEGVQPLVDRVQRAIAAITGEPALRR